MKEIPLLLIHGYPFDHTMWFSTIASLGSKAKVIAPDLPGFGKEPALRGTKPSMEAYADFLVRQLGDYHYEKVAVAGMSMGGYVALAFAEKHPSRIACLGPISAGLSNEIVVFYLGKNLRQIGAGGGHGSEKIHVHRVPFARVRTWHKQKEDHGIAIDPKVYVGLYFLSAP